MALLCTIFPSQAGFLSTRSIRPRSKSWKQSINQNLEKKPILRRTTAVKRMQIFCLDLEHEFYFLQTWLRNLRAKKTFSIASTSNLISEKESILALADFSRSATLSLNPSSKLPSECSCLRLDDDAFSLEEAEAPVTALAMLSTSA